MIFATHCRIKLHNVVKNKRLLQKWTLCSLERGSDEANGTLAQYSPNLPLGSKAAQKNARRTKCTLSAVVPGRNKESHRLGRCANGRIFTEFARLLSEMEGDKVCCLEGLPAHDKRLSRAPRAFTTRMGHYTNSLPETHTANAFTYMLAELLCVCICKEKALKERKRSAWNTPTVAPRRGLSDAPKGLFKRAAAAFVIKLPARHQTRRRRRAMQTATCRDDHIWNALQSIVGAYGFKLAHETN